MTLKTQFITLSAVVLLVTSCKNDSKNSEVTAESTKELVESVYDDNNFTQKYNGYISFQNYSHNSLMKKMDRYYKDFDPSKPLNKNNRPIIWSHSISAHSSNLLKNTDVKPNFGEIDNVGKTLSKQAKSVDSLLALSAFYYSKKTHEKDNFKEGQLLSDQLESTLTTYYKTYTLFKDEMDMMADELTNRDLVAFKEANQMVRYNMLSLINESDKLLDYIYEANQNSFKSTDMEKLDALLDAFNKPLTALEKLSLDQEALKKELGFKYSNVPGLIRVGASLVRNVNGLKDRITSNNWKYKITHPSIPDDGSVEKVSRVYNDLITNYNRSM